MTKFNFNLTFKKIFFPNIAYNTLLNLGVVVTDLKQTFTDFKTIPSTVTNKTCATAIKINIAAFLMENDCLKDIH